MADDSKFNPFMTGLLYQRHHERWQLETDFAEMTLDVLRQGAYLPKFSAKEHIDDYAYRKSMSVPLDICRDAVRIRIDNLWRTPPKREVKEGGAYADILQRLLADADTDGTDLDAFMKRALWNYYVTGVDIVTQVTQAPEGIELQTKLQEQQAGIRPYFMQFTPLQRYDWAANGWRNFRWVRYCLGRKPRLDEQGADSREITEFLTLTPTEWRRHLAVKQEGQDAEPVVSTTTGNHEFGRPPVVRFYFSESQKADQACVPLSLLSRPSVVAKVLLNVKSQADADLLAAVTRWFATGIGPNDEIGDTYGPGMLIRFNNPDTKVIVAQGDVAHIAEKRNWCLLYIGEILRLFKFRGGMAEIQAHSGSGLKLAMERTDLDNELRSTADQLEATELEMMRQAVCLLKGVEIKPENAGEALGYSVSYNRDFVLEPVGEMLDNIKTWVTGCGMLSEEFPETTKEMVRQIVNMLVRQGAPVQEVMMEEIDKADLTGSVEPATSFPPKEATGTAE